MQRFTLIHDGSDQGWQTAYLAFHIAARLGAPLLVLLVNSSISKKVLVQRAAQVEVGGRAAGVAIETRLVTEFSVDALMTTIGTADGLFVPHRLIPDRETAARFLEALSCPLWIVSEGSEVRKLAVLIDDFAADEELLNYTTVLSHRIQQSLTGLVQENELALSSGDESDIAWLPLSDFSPIEITAVLNQLDVNILFLPETRLSLIEDLSANCVVWQVP